MSKKNFLSRTALQVKETFKRSATQVAGKALRKQCFPIFGVPSGLTDGVREGKVHYLYNATPLSLSPPKTIDPEIFWCYTDIMKCAGVDAHGILTVPHGIATKVGGNLSPQGKLITTFLQPIDGKPPHQHDLLRFSSKKFFPTLYHANQPVVSMTAGWQRAFYHWIYEVLPRFHLVERGGFSQEKIYIDAGLPFQRESLELLGIQPSQIIQAEAYNGVKTPELVIPSTPLLPTDWGCRFLREKMLPRLTPKKRLRLYVSRADATRRRILNEGPVFELLQRYGFIKIELSQLTFKEQAEYFQAADVVVGPHGAGFSHLVFCNPGTPFLEIFSPAYFNPCYWHVSERVGLSYYYLFGKGDRYAPGTRFHLDPDIEVDLGQLEASLRLMGCCS